METPVDEPLPALRPVDVVAFHNHNNELHFALRDLTRMAPEPVAISLPGYFVVAHLDGRHSADAIREKFQREFGRDVDRSEIERVVAALDQALLLSTPRFERVYEEQRSAFARAECRDNRDAWPAADALRRELDKTLAGGAAPQLGKLAGIVAPHLDYRRGKLCYADAFAALAHASPAARYVILGTNHFGRSTGVVATSKPFETPLGRVPTDAAMIEELERALGASLREHELDHRAEHSIELPVHILQHVRAAQPFSIVPILCPDPTGPARSDSASVSRERCRASTPDSNASIRPGDVRGELDRFADALREFLQRDAQPTVVIASADLSHVGQRFGDPQPSTRQSLSDLEQNDRRLLGLLEQRNEVEFVETVRAAQNPTRICSVGCIYAALRALPGRDFHLLRYHQAVDEDNDTTVTSVAAVIVEAE